MFSRGLRPLKRQSKRTRRTKVARRGSRNARSTAESRRAFSSASSYPYPTAGNLLKEHPSSKVSTLGNNMRVATEEIDCETATVGVWIDVGSRFEDEKSNGVAHFMEHMIFKGTSNRTMVQLEKEIENMGAHLNAYTSRESTVFYAKVMKDQVPAAVDILADILQNSKLDASAVEREKGVILREAQEVEADQYETVFDLLHSTAYQRCPLGFTILGPTENIKSITSADIQDHINTHYTGDRMVVCAAGAVDHDALAGLVEQKFGSIQPNAPSSVQMAPAIFTGSEIHSRHDSLPLAHVTYAFETFGWDHPDSFALMAMQNLLGSWELGNTGGEHSSSQLIAEVSKEKMAQSIHAFVTQYSDTGLFGIHASAEDRALHDLMHTIQTSINKLSYDVSERRLHEAKHNLAMGVMQSFDGTTAVCEDIGRQMLQYGRRMHPLESLARINALTVEDIHRVANNYFYDREFALAAHGPTYEMPDYNLLREKTYHLL